MADNDSGERNSVNYQNSKQLANLVASFVYIRKGHNGNIYNKVSVWINLDKTSLPLAVWEWCLSSFP